jgi:hypothetical protein
VSRVVEGSICVAGDGGAGLGRAVLARMAVFRLVRAVYQPLFFVFLVGAIPHGAGWWHAFGIWNDLGI